MLVFELLSQRLQGRAKLVINDTKVSTARKRLPYRAGEYYLPFAVNYSNRGINFYVYSTILFLYLNQIFHLPQEAIKLIAFSMWCKKYSTLFNVLNIYRNTPLYLMSLIFTVFIAARKYNIMLEFASKTKIKSFERQEQRAKLLINDTKISICVDSLEYHCNVACVSLLYINFNQLYAREIKEFVSKITWFIAH